MTKCPDDTCTIDLPNDERCEIDLIRKPGPYDSDTMDTCSHVMPVDWKAMAVVHYTDGTSETFRNVRKVAHIGRVWVMINFHGTTPDTRDHGKRTTIPYETISKRGIDTTSDVRVSFSDPAVRCD